MSIQEKLNLVSPEAKQLYEQIVGAYGAKLVFNYSLKNRIKWVKTIEKGRFSIYFISKFFCRFSGFAKSDEFDNFSL